MSWRAAPGHRLTTSIHNITALSKAKLDSIRIVPHRSKDLDAVNLRFERTIMPLSDLQEHFIKYVMNDIPIRLIHLDTMQLVDRSFVRRYFQQRVDALTETALRDISNDRPVAIWTFVQSTVKYAILSHRWVDGEELSFEDMMKNRATGSGYEKVQKFCEKARSNGLEFAWVDTCCINKSSSTELDESLRSMFRWYQNSSICIVHLAQTTILSDLPEDEWLERGWTLQEYIAPQTMKFFNKDWIPLTDLSNDKADQSPVIRLIEEATGIVVDDSFSPGTYYVDQRMTWAATRKTTREEDAAYCLMGIFKVSIQVAYGEGAELAFTRLMQAIMQGGDPSALNWAGYSASHPSSDAIPTSPASYVGHPPCYRPHPGARLDMTLTSWGLRVPLLVLPLKPVEASANASGTIRLHCPCLPQTAQIRLQSVVTPQTTPTKSRALVFPETVQQQLEVDKSPSTEYALGIFTFYHPRQGTFNPGLPNTSVAYLLQRDGLSGGDVPNPLLGLHEITWEMKIGGWRDWYRVEMDSFVTVCIPEVPVQTSTVLANEHFFFVSRDYLRTVYL